MKKFSLILVSSIVLFGCSHNSITGRNQLALLPESELRSMALTEYKQFLTSNKVVSSSASKMQRW